jgi:hypothetical protein
MFLFCFLFLLFLALILNLQLKTITTKGSQVIYLLLPRTAVQSQIILYSSAVYGVDSRYHECGKTMGQKKQVACNSGK